MKNREITREALSEWSENYRGSAERRIATLAVSKTDLNSVAYSASDAFSVANKFSVEIKTLPVTDQQASGRCWLFAATNLLREGIAAEHELENFQLSQSWLAFWDKLERANYFLEAIIETAALPVNDRTVAFILSSGVHDGGQWEMFANIVRKYGIVPRDVFGETFQTSHTGMMNHYLNRNLKACAAKLRRMIADGTSASDVREEKCRMLDRIYGFLCTCYTEPPETFDFEYVDKNGGYHIEKGMTPLKFAEKYAFGLLDRTVSIINAPTADKPYHKTYTVRYLGNVVGAGGVIHLNLPMDEFKQAIIRQLEAGRPVWFGSDVGKFGEREKGIWDDNSFRPGLLTGLDLDISKEDALDYLFSAMNHAMVITGVNLDEGRPTRWKIENSWGDKNGEKGYYVCTDSWFDAYVYQAAVEKEYLGDLAAFAELPPVELAPWDPMGTLADSRM
ncbi:MAG: C1 family peptidase [Clostridia bacterium]|nr:C1 family peptidase [Clostridia bacterium]